MDKPSSSPTSANPASSCSPSSPAKPLNRPPSSCVPGSNPCPIRCARPSPSTMEPSSLSTISSKPSSVSKPSSAIPTAPGKRVASKTPSVACVARCPARPTWQPSTPISSMPVPPPTTSHPESASASKPLPKPSFLNCCTSNVNPSTGLRRDDDLWCLPLRHPMAGEVLQHPDEAGMVPALAAQCGGGVK